MTIEEIAREATRKLWDADELDRDYRYDDTEPETVIAIIREAIEKAAPLIRVAVLRDLSTKLYRSELADGMAGRTLVADELRELAGKEEGKL